MKIKNKIKKNKIKNGSGILLYDDGSDEDRGRGGGRGYWCCEGDTHDDNDRTYRMFKDQTMRDARAGSRTLGTYA